MLLWRRWSDRLRGPVGASWLDGAVSGRARRLPARHPGRQPVRRGDPARPPHRAGRSADGAALLAGTAAVGSYTTFSTWMLETQRLAEEGQLGTAAVNVAASLVAGVAAAALGRLLGALICDHRTASSSPRYFGERHRAGGRVRGRRPARPVRAARDRDQRPAARHRGLRAQAPPAHRPRLLSLSEDLPLVAVAVDTRPRIEAVLGAVRALTAAGLVTPGAAPGCSAADSRRSRGPTRRPSSPSTCGRQERVYRVPAFVAVCDLLHRRGVGRRDRAARRRRHRPRPPASARASSAATPTCPLMVIAVGAGERIGARSLPELGALLRRPLATARAGAGLQARRPRCSRAPPELPAPTPTASRSGRSSWCTLRAGARAGRPLHASSCGGCAGPGATARPRCAGSGASTAITRRTATGCCRLRRRVPVVTVVVDTPPRIREWFEIVDALTQDTGLVTQRDGARAAGHGPRDRARRAAPGGLTFTSQSRVLHRRRAPGSYRGGR